MCACVRACVCVVVFFCDTFVPMFLSLLRLVKIYASLITWPFRIVSSCCCLGWQSGCWLRLLSAFLWGRLDLFLLSRNSARKKKKPTRWNSNRKERPKKVIPHRLLKIKTTGQQQLPMIRYLFYSCFFFLLLCCPTFLYYNKSAPSQVPQSGETYLRGEN